MELPWEQETNTFFLVHKIPEASKGVTWADNTMEMSSSASEFTDDRSIDDIIEIKNKKTNSHKGKVVRWVRSHKCETIALVILVIGLILIPISVLAYLGNKNSTTEPVLAEESVIAQQTSSPAALPNVPVSTPASTPTTAPATIPTSTTSTTSPVAAALPTAPGATLMLRPQLVDELGDEIKILLEDPGSPQNMAYNWIMEQDEMRWDQEYSTVVQRFLLATFYFATGGRLTTPSWHVCSAFPNNQLQGQTNTNTFNGIKCVSENDENDNDTTTTTTRVCAKFDDFEECPEYYERFELEAPSNPKKRWLSWTNECDWYGIVCDQQGLVTQISLPKNGLQGSLVSELSFLGRLTTLNLRENELGGTLPAWTGWNYLQHLSLSDNALKGPIPTEWQEWTWLETLDLANNQVTGSLALPNNWINIKTLILGDNSLYVELSEELGSAHKLETLDLHGNTLSSNLPLSLTNLQQLMEFNVAGCGVAGTIPSEFVNLPKLVELQLQDNGFFGMIPEELWELTELEILRLEDNQLSGTLSTGIGNLVHLEELRLSRTGLEGDLPTELANLQQLERANLEFNQFKGRIPNELCEVSTLKELTADCRGSKKVKCDCCTQCCDKKDDTCQDPDQTRNSMGNHRL